MIKEEYIESSVVELKRELSEETKKEIVSFLNTSGGTVYIGVNDDGTINESFAKHSSDKECLKVISWVQEAIYPVPSSLVDVSINEDRVLRVEVKEGSSKPYFLREKGPAPDGVYKRIGAATRKCNEDEILKMIMDTRDYKFEQDISEEQELTFKYFDKICEEQEIETTVKQKIFWADR